MIDETGGANYFDLIEMHALLRTSFVDKIGLRKYYAVAVYTNESGDSGEALIISKDINFKKIERVEHRSGITGFSALINNDNKSLVWTFCLYCEDYSTIETVVPFLDKKDK